MNNTAYRPPPVRHHHIRTWGRRPRLPNGSVLAGTPSHRPSAPPRAPAGARSKRGPRRSGPGHAVLTRRRLGHPDPAGDQPDAVPLGTRPTGTGAGDNMIQGATDADAFSRRASMERVQPGE